MNTRQDAKLWDKLFKVSIVSAPIFAGLMVSLGLWLTQEAFANKAFRENHDRTFVSKDAYADLKQQVSANEKDIAYTRESLKEIKELLNRINDKIDKLP